jgi:hypothetical protein
VAGQRHAQADLQPGNRPVTDGIAEWVGTSAGLDRSGNFRLSRFRSPDGTVLIQSLDWLSYPGLQYRGPSTNRFGVSKLLVFELHVCLRYYALYMWYTVYRVPFVYPEEVLDCFRVSGRYQDSFQNLNCPTTQLHIHCSLEHVKLQQITLTVTTASVPGLKPATSLNYSQNYKFRFILKKFMYFVNINRLILYTNIVGICHSIVEHNCV